MRRIALWLALGSLSGGCAFTDIRLTLPTRSLDNTVSGGNSRQVIVATPFTDRREIHERCGMQKNGYNMDTADAICQSDPNAWIADLLAEELRAAGFSVLQSGVSHRPSALQIEGSLNKLFVEPVVGAWTGSLEADLAVTLRATTESGLEAERSFFVKGWKGGMMASTKQPYHTALDRATQALLEEMVRAVVELMDRYPQLGYRDAPGIVVVGRLEEVQR